MSLFIPQQRSGLLHHAKSAEELAWEALYRAANDPASAAEVVEYLDHDEAARKSHLALYLVCRQTVRMQEIRLHRAERIAYLLQCVLIGFAWPFLAPLRFIRGSLDAVIAMMPKSALSVPAKAQKREPAAKRVRKLVRKSEYADVKRRIFASSVVHAVSPEPAGSEAGGVPAVVADGAGSEAFAPVSTKPNAA